MSAALQTFLFDTLLWTAALIALVLMLRRPVSRFLGPKAAYALWALPALRLVLPPLVLPASIAPVTEPIGQSALQVTYSSIPAEVGPAVEGAAFNWASVATGAMAVWLIGAVVFLVVRFTLYFRLRRDLLAGAYPVGEEGQIRLVETPATNSPVAFGVIDKVIALPEGFMALTDRTKRDLALEHELAHHRAHDLLVNLVVQPLFALHWFNPLGWFGWLALRRDQEAACDARVVAARGDQDKAAYAAVIADFAAGAAGTRMISLAAPMACPVIGEKSIIHRLRSLTMNEISPRRRFAGRFMIGAALLALPLTASISYAESLTAPSAPVAPVAPAAPTPPVAPVLLLQATSDAPDAPEVTDTVEWIEEDGGAKRVFVIRNDETDGNGDEKRVIHREHKMIMHGDEKLTKEERTEIMSEVREALDGMDVELREAEKEIRVAMIEMDAAGGKTKVNVECKEGGMPAKGKTVKGERVFHICSSEIMASALSGLKEARNEIATNPEMPKDIRNQVLKALDEKIASWGNEG